jgi:hypothetical protein
MIQIQLFDGTVLEFPQGTSQDVIDRVARQETLARQGVAQEQPSEMMQRIEAARAGTLQPSPDALARAASADEMALAQMQPPRTLGQMLYENVIGSGEVDTLGERAGEFIRGGTAAVARGMADVPALPANIAQLGAAGVERLLGMEAPSMVSRGLAALPDTRSLLSSVPVIGPESEYVAPGRAGRFVSTAGEFAGGAGLAAGPKAMLRYGVAPGVASEGAGQMTEGREFRGIDLEPIARAAAGIGTAIAAAPRSAAYTRGGTPDELAMANRLSEAGVRPTAGQVANSERLMRLENTAGPTGQQLDDFTAAALRTTGNTTANRATPTVLRSTQKSITDGMDNILRNVDVPITPQLGQRVSDVAQDYFLGTAGRDLPVALRKIGDELFDVATKPGSIGTIPASRLRQWRSIAGTYTTSSNELAREAAHAFRSLIDDASESALTALGRADDIRELATYRNQYRNFLTLADASTKGGREAARGVLTPERVSSASTRTVGHQSRATGRGTDLTQLSNDALAMIGSASTVAPGAFRNVALAGGGAGVAGGAGMLFGGLPGALIGAGIGASAPTATQSIMRSNAVQNLLNNPYSVMQSAPVLPGLLSQ